MATMKNKPISFNVDNPNDQLLFDHVKDINNFSGYVKTLIATDLKNTPKVQRSPEGSYQININ